MIYGSFLLKRTFFILFLLIQLALNAAPAMYQGRIRPHAVVMKLEGIDSKNALLMLPDRYDPARWHPLESIELHEKNFTRYSDRAFTQIKTGDREQALSEAYSEIAGTPSIRTLVKSQTFPTLLQLRVEEIYYAFPWTEATLAGYLLAAGLLFYKRGLGLICFGAAFLCHLALLAMRVVILSRPPVANMVETVLFVPFIAVLSGMGYAAYRKTVAPLAAAALSTAILFGILRALYPLHPMDPVPAVLDSQLWLTIHVLMVVGSYGVFLLGSILGHAALITERLKLRQAILFCLYTGTGLLICGTVLGGVWAAQSWGRFWDWDPKETWAFVSSCVYLMGIHAYRFGKIGNRGLALTAAVGFLFISFTWYGVNYILGTGLHSYGFGQGGEWAYTLFVAGDAVLITTLAVPSRLSLNGLIRRIEFLQ